MCQIFIVSVFFRAPCLVGPIGSRPSQSTRTIRTRATSPARSLARVDEDNGASIKNAFSRRHLVSMEP
jgi:hypothetical protein